MNTTSLSPTSDISEVSEHQPVDAAIARRQDLVRSTTTLVLALLCGLLRLLPVVRIGRVKATLAASGTRLAPSTAAFVIDGALVVCLIGYALWQFLPHQRSRALHRTLGWCPALVAVFDAAWPLVITGPGALVVRLWLAGVLVTGLCAVLALNLHRIHHSPDLKHADLYLVDLPFGIHLGWTTVLAPASVAAAIVESGLRPAWWLSDLLAIGVLVAIAGLLTWWCFWLGDRMAVAFSAAWGLAWIGVARITSTPHSGIVAACAFVAAAHVVIFTWHHGRRA